MRNFIAVSDWGGIRFRRIAGIFTIIFVHAGMSDGRAVAVILSLAFLGGVYGVMGL